MNPSEKLFQELKRQEKAFSLTDRDTHLVNPDLSQADQLPHNQKDIEFYKKQYQEALDRSYPDPLPESDRHALEALQQVLHLTDAEVQAIHEQVEGFKRQLDRTVLQDSTTTVEPPRAMLEESDKRFSPAADPGYSSDGSHEHHESNLAEVHQTASPASESSASGHEFNLTATPSAATAANAEPDANLSPNRRAIMEGGKSVILKEEAASPENLPPDQAGQPLASDTQFTAPAQAQPEPGQPATVQVEIATESPAAASQEAAEVRAAPASTPAQHPAPRSPQRKVDTRPWWSLLPLAAILIGVGVGAWLAYRNYAPAPTPDPAAAENFFQSGTQQARQGQNAKAIADLDQAIKLNPNDPNLYLNRGVAYFQKGDFSAALNDYNQAIKLNPNFAEAWNNRSQVYVLQQKYTEAFNDASQAINLNPNVTEAYLNRGNALFGNNNLDNALQDYQKVQASTDPALQSRAYNNIGNLNAARNQLDTAITNYDQAIALVRSYADAFFNRAVALQRKNRTEEAIQGFRDAANLYQNQGNQDMARRAQGIADRLQQGSGQQAPASPQPSPSPSG